MPRGITLASTLTKMKSGATNFQGQLDAVARTVMPWDYDNESGDQRRVMWRQTMGIDDTTQSDGHVDRVGQPPFGV